MASVVAWKVFIGLLEARAGHGHASCKIGSYPFYARPQKPGVGIAGKKKSEAWKRDLVTWLSGELIANTRYKGGGGGVWRCERRNGLTGGVFFFHLFSFSYGGRNVWFW